MSHWSPVRRHFAAAALVLLVALSLAAPAGAQPSAQLSVTSVSPLPATTHASDSRVLRGTVANSGRNGGGTVTIRLLKRGQKPAVIGRARVRVAAGESSRYRVPVTVPAGLAHGTYVLAACTARGGESGVLRCATAPRGVIVGRPGPVRGARVATAASLAADPTCSSGAHTLSEPGDHVYPEQGNGGYRSVHTDVNLVYDALTNTFLDGNNVVLTDEATECLTDFSLDFERNSAPAEEEEDDGSITVYPGADLEVKAVTIDGEEAGFEFVQPTYPGDPNGQDDPDPAAHESGQDIPVSETNPLPPACTPSDPSPEANGQPCPANKLVILPSQPIPAGQKFELRIEYTGRPGVHTDGDGSAEGWFRSDRPAGDGAFVTTEPVGTMAWMPLNNHPTAKPTYDFDETVTKGRTAIANGELVSVFDNPADARFPDGSTTWRWHSPEPIANYLVESSIGSFDLSERLAADGTLYYQAQGSSLTPEEKAANKEIIDQQEDITHFQELTNGPYPFTSNGSIIGIPTASFQEEMQGKITFNGGSVTQRALVHENMHQWFGDNVSESNFNETFYKEGFARFSEYTQNARVAAAAAGGMGTPEGEAAFEASLAAQFATNYNTDGTRHHERWTKAPSNPTPASLFRLNETTYDRPATAYIALRQILGKVNFGKALLAIQQDFGGGSIEESQLKAEFHRWLPNQSPICHARLSTFFTEWLDTEFPASGGLAVMRPRFTGPGLIDSASGNSFYGGACEQVSPAAPVTGATILPAPAGGKVSGPATVVLTVTDPGAGEASTEFRLDGGAFEPYAGPFAVSSLGAHTVEYRSTDRNGVTEATKQVSFTVVPSTSPTPPGPSCEHPRLRIAVSHPLRRDRNGVILRRGVAYRFHGRLGCGSGPAPRGTVVDISTVSGGQTSALPGLAVGGGGEIDTLLRFSSTRTVVFSFDDGDHSARARVRVAVRER